MARWAATVDLPSEGVALVSMIDRSRPSKSERRIVLRTVRIASSKSEIALSEPFGLRLELRFGTIELVLAEDAALAESRAEERSTGIAPIMSTPRNLPASSGSRSVVSSES